MNIRRIAELIRGSGGSVHELRTMRPGYVLYKDAHQIMALPFAVTLR